MKFFKRLNHAIIQFEQIISGLLLILIIAFVFFSAITRYLNISFVWSLDFTLLLFAWFAFFACSQATRKKAHLGVDLLVVHFPTKIQQAISVFNDILMTIFMGIMIYYSVYASIVNVKQKITSIGISYSFISMSLAIAGAFIFLALLAQLIEHILILIGKKTTEDFKIY